MNAIRIPTLCGRFTLSVTSKDLKDQFEVTPPPGFEFESYNIAPSQLVPIIHLHENQKRTFSMMQWGLLPSWAKEAEHQPRPINARLETVQSNAMFKSALISRRCLIPVTGFYEWDPKATPKQPHYFYKKNNRLFAFAGLWNHWQKEHQIVYSFTIITKEADEFVKSIHGRMPVNLNKQDYDKWLLNCQLPHHSTALEHYPVRLAVNSPRNNGRALIEPIDFKGKRT